MDLAPFGRLLLILGTVLIALGGLLAFGPKIPWIGRLPGDIRLGGEGWRVYIPLGTSLLVSLLLTAFLWILRRR